MITHIVLFKAGQLDDAQRLEFETAVESLRDVPGVGDMTWGRDFSGRGQGYTVAATFHMADRDALAVYTDHPQHQNAVGIFNRLGVDRLVIDYETGTIGISA